MILINMKMPHSCSDCPLTYDSFDGSTICTLNPNKYIDWDKRPDYCPLHNLRKNTKETKEESKDEPKEVDETISKEYVDLLEKIAAELSNEDAIEDPKLLTAIPPENLHFPTYSGFDFHDFDTATALTSKGKSWWTIKPSTLINNDTDFPDVTF